VSREAAKSGVLKFFSVTFSVTGLPDRENADPPQENGFKAAAGDSV
jgi:hypothetical protein